MIEGLIDIRREAREERDWELSDIIRDYLDTRNVFCFDTKDGQEVWHIPQPTITRAEMIKKIQKDITANNNFNGWLYTQWKKCGYSEEEIQEMLDGQ